MIVRLAMVTGTAPSAWWDEDEATIATALEVWQDMHPQD